MKIKKNLFMKVLMLSFVFLMVSPLSLHAAGVTKLIVGTTTVVEGGEVTGSSSGSGWSYANNTLTLNGYNGSSIKAEGDLTIQVRGQNTIKADTLTPETKGIEVDGTLTIRGVAADYSDTLNISSFDYAIYTSNKMVETFTSVNISQASLNIINSNYGIFAENENVDGAEIEAKDVANNIELRNSVVTIDSKKGTIILKGANTSTIRFTRLAENYDIKRNQNTGYVSFYIEDSLAVNLNIYPGYRITYSLNLLSLTQGSSLNYLTNGNDFSCGFNVEDTNYALPTSVTIKVNGTELSKDKYTYNSTTGIITVSRDNINGDIEVVAAAEPCDPNPQTGTLEVVVKLGLSLGLIGVIILAKSLKLV